MVAVRAYYDGHVFVPLGQMTFRVNQQAMVVVDELPLDAKKSCRGIAAKYANPALIEKESAVASLAFSEAENDVH